MGDLTPEEYTIGTWLGMEQLWKQERGLAAPLPPYGLAPAPAEPIEDNS